MPPAPPRRRASTAKPAAPRPRTEKPVAAPVDRTPRTLRKKAVVAGPRGQDVAGPKGLDEPVKPAAKAKRAPRRAAEPSALDKLQQLIVASLEDDKAEEIVTLDLAGRAAFCERMVIANGLADRQIAAMAEHLREKLHQAGVSQVPIEGGMGSEWVLIDAGDIVVHLFRPDARVSYALEKMWGAELDEVG